MSLGLTKSKAWFECLVGLEEGVQTKPRSGFVLNIASCWLFFKCFFKSRINCSYYGGLASFNLSRITSNSLYFPHRYGSCITLEQPFLT